MAPFKAFTKAAETRRSNMTGSAPEAICCEPSLAIARSPASFPMS